MASQVLFEAVDRMIDAMRLITVHGESHKNCTTDCPILLGAMALQSDMAKRASAMMPPLPASKPKAICRYCGSKIEMS